VVSPSVHRYSVKTLSFPGSGLSNLQRVSETASSKNLGFRPLTRLCNTKGRSSIATIILWRTFLINNILFGFYGPRSSSITIPFNISSANPPPPSLHPNPHPPPRTSPQHLSSQPPASTQNRRELSLPLHGLIAHMPRQRGPPSLTFLQISMLSPAFSWGARYLTVLGSWLHGPLVEHDPL